jgi:hypothetical protein
VLRLSQADRNFLIDLRNYGVLTDVFPTLIKNANGICIVTCADGDHFDNVYSYHRNMMISQGLTPRIHVLSSHGGALVLPLRSSLNKNRRGDNLLEMMRETEELKDIHTFALEAHAPCGAAGLAKLNIYKQFQLHRQADAIIQNQLPGAQVICFFHALWENNRERTYFFSGINWRQFLQEKSDEIKKIEMACL